MNLLIMNSGESESYRQPEGPHLQRLAEFARGGFGDVASVIPGLAGVMVKGELHDFGAVYFIEAEGHVLASAFVAVDQLNEELIWYAAESAYLQDSDKYAKEMHAEACPSKPDSLPWVAVTLWPILYNQNSPHAIENVKVVVVAAANGVAAALAERGPGRV